MHAVLSNCLELLFDKLSERMEKSRPLKPLLVFSSKGLSKQFIGRMARIGVPMAPVCLSLDEFLDLAFSLFYPHLYPRISEAKRIHVLEALYEKIVAKDFAFESTRSSLLKIFESNVEARPRFFNQLSSLIKACEHQGAMHAKLTRDRSLEIDFSTLVSMLYFEMKQSGYSTLEDCNCSEPQPVFTHIAFVGFDRLDKEVIRLLKAIDTKALVELYALVPTMHYIADLNREVSGQSQLIASFGSHKKALQAQLVDFGIDAEAYFSAPFALKSKYTAEQILVDSLAFEPQKPWINQSQCSLLDAYKMHLAALSSSPIKMDFSNDVSICTRAFKRPVDEVKGLLLWLNVLHKKRQLEKKCVRVYLAHPGVYAPLIKAYFDQQKIPYTLLAPTNAEAPRLIDSFLFALSFAHKRWSIAELVSLFEAPFFLPNAPKKEFIEVLRSFAQKWKFSSGLSLDHKTKRLQKGQRDLEDVNVQNLCFYTFESAVLRWAKQMIDSSNGLIEQENIALVIEHLRKLNSLLEPIKENACLPESEVSKTLLALLNAFFKPSLNDSFQGEFDAVRQKIQAIETLNLSDGVRIQTAVYELKKNAHSKSVQEKDPGIVICPFEKKHLMQSDIACVLGFDEHALKDPMHTDFKDFTLHELKSALFFPAKSELYLDLLLMTKEAIYLSHAEKVLGKACRFHPGLHLLQNDVKKALFCTKRNAFVDLALEAENLDIDSQNNTLPSESFSTSLNLSVQDKAAPSEKGMELAKEHLTLYDLRILLSNPLRWHYMQHLGDDPFDARSLLSSVQEEDGLLEVFERGTSLYEGLLSPILIDSMPSNLAQAKELEKNELECVLALWKDQLKNSKVFSLELTPLRSTLIQTEREGRYAAYAPAVETDQWRVTGKVRAALHEGVIALGKIDAKKQWLFAPDALALKAAGFAPDILFIHEGKKKTISGDMEQLLKYAEFSLSTPSPIYFDTLDLIVNKDAEKLQRKLFDKAFGYQPDLALAHYLDSNKDLDMQELIEKLHPLAQMLKEMIYE